MTATVQERQMLVEMLPATKSRGEAVMIYFPSETERGGLLRIDEGGKREQSEYLVVEIEATAGRGFRCVKRRGVSDKTTASEDVFLANDRRFRDYCTCRGNQRFGHCKHVDALRVVLASGAMPE